MSSTPPEGPQGPQDQPQQPDRPEQPPYGQAYPPPPTHQPYGQPYGQPFPGSGDPRQEGRPSKAMAITSLALSFLFCVPFVAAIASIVLGVVVLGRSKDGRDHGRGMAIAGIVISTLVMLATIAVVVVAVVVGLNTFKSVNDLQPGDCISAEDLLDSDAEGFGQLTIEPCTEEHDAEVVAATTLDGDDAEAYPDGGSSEICQNLVLDDPELVALLSPDLDLLTITDSAEPEAGDTVACILFNSDGSPLEEPLAD